MDYAKNSIKTPQDVLRYLRPFIKPYWMRLVVGVACGMLFGASTFGLLAAFRFALGGMSGEEVSMFGISSMTEAQGNAGDLSLRRIIFVVSFLPIVALIQGLFYFIGRYFVEWVGNRMVADIRSHMFAHIHALPMQFFSKSRVGDLISRVTSDTGLLTQLVTNVVGDMIREPFTLIGCIVFMLDMDWRLSLIALVIFPVCIIPVQILGRRIRKASKKGQQGIGDMLSVVQETVGGALVVKAFQMEDEETSRFNLFNAKVFRMQMKQSCSRAMNDPSMTFLSSLGLSGIVVYAYISDISINDLLVFGAAVMSMYRPAKKLSKIHMRISKAAPGLERVFEVLDIKNTIENAPDAVPFSGKVQQVEFKNVEFAYEDKLVLNDINLKSEAGQCIAFVGSSGSGKTTLVNLIPRFFDVSYGSVELNGRDVREYTVESLRSQIGVVTQDTVLFNRSVADNIAYGSLDAPREAIIDAAKRANAHEFIMNLDGGLNYDTVIGERGSLLSGGMRQRMAIARALLKNPPILILDEATSALDTESERLVQGALNELMKDRTVFVIAHRLSTITHADQIIVLDQGEIVERGTHAELLAQGGKYKYLHDIQFGANRSE